MGNLQKREGCNIMDLKVIGNGETKRRHFENKPSLAELVNLIKTMYSLKKSCAVFHDGKEVDEEYLRNFNGGLFRVSFEQREEKVEEKKEESVVLDVAQQETPIDVVKREEAPKPILVKVVEKKEEKKEKVQPDLLRQAIRDALKTEAVQEVLTNHILDALQPVIDKEITRRMDEERRMEEERRAEDRRKAEEETARRLQEEKRRKEEEHKRQQEEKKRIEEEKERLEHARLEEENKRVEEEKKRMEEEKQRLELERRRLEDERKQIEEEERQRKEEEEGKRKEEEERKEQEEKAKAMLEHANNREQQAGKVDLLPPKEEEEHIVFKTLIDMGFDNVEKNKELAKIHGNNLEAIIQA